MKLILSIYLLLVTCVSYSQDSTQVEKAEPPRIVSKLSLGKSLLINDIEVKFLKVEQDSRCPKNVTCIWAGEVIVLVDIFKKGKKIEQKKLTISSKNSIEDFFGNIFSSEDLTISALGILPYPVAGNKTNPEDYYIQLEVIN